MSVMILAGLMIISTIAILIDCYAACTLFLMTAMPIGYYLSPFLLLFIVIAAPIIFIATVINLFKFKKWSYYTFFVSTSLLHYFLIHMDLYFLKIKAIKSISIEQSVPMLSLLLFVSFFLLPAVRKMFK